MLLGDVGDFMSQHTGDLVLIIRRQNQPAVQGYHTTRGGKGIDDILIDDYKGKFLVRPVTVGSEAEAHILEKGADKRIFIQHFIGAHLAYQGFGVFSLLGP